MNTKTLGSLPIYTPPGLTWAENIRGGASDVKPTMVDDVPYIAPDILGLSKILTQASMNGSVLVTGFSNHENQGDFCTELSSVMKLRGTEAIAVDLHNDEIDQSKQCLEDATKKSINSRQDFIVIKGIEHMARPKVFEALGSTVTALLEQAAQPYALGHHIVGVGQLATDHSFAYTEDLR